MPEQKQKRAQMPDHAVNAPFNGAEYKPGVRPPPMSIATYNAIMGRDPRGYYTSIPTENNPDPSITRYVPTELEMQQQRASAMARIPGTNTPAPYAGQMPPVTVADIARLLSGQ